MDGFRAAAPPAALARAFTDPDEFAAALPNMSSEHLPLPGAKRFEVRLARLQFGATMAQVFGLGSPMLTRGTAIGSGTVGLLLPLPEAAEAPSVNGVPLAAGQGVLIACGAELAVRVPAHQNWAGVVVPVAVPEAVLDGARLASAALQVLHLPAGPAQRLAGALTAAARMAEGGPGALPLPRDWPGLVRALHEGLAAVLSGGEPAAAPRAGGRALCLVRDAEAFLAAHPSEAIYLQDLCAALAVAPRTLSGAFGSVLGVGPIAYLKLRRLALVRRALLAGGRGQDLVKSAALGHGFWHLGHFAQDYRAMFGELPSETAARRIAGSG